MSVNLILDTRFVSKCSICGALFSYHASDVKVIGWEFGKGDSRTKIYGIECPAARRSSDTKYRCESVIS